HVRLTQRSFIHLGELADRVADDGVPQVEFALVAVGERAGGEVHGRQRQGLLVEAGEVLTKQPRLLQLAAGRANRFARPGECLHGASLEGLALLNLVGGWGRDRLTGVVLVEGQRDVLAAGLGLDVLDRVAVFLEEVGIEGVAIFILRRRVPGLALRQVLLAYVLLLTRSSEGPGIDAGSALGSHPLVERGAETVVRAVERDVVAGYQLAV